MAGGYPALYEAAYGGTAATEGPSVSDPFAGLSPSTVDVLERLPEGWVDSDPLLRTLVAAFALALDELDALAADGDDGQPGWLKLVDPDAAETIAQVAWAGQLVGATVPPGATLTEARTAVTDSAGWKRGTVAAIKAAVRPFLRPGTGDVDIVERVGGDAWAVTIRARDEQVGGRRLYQLKNEYVGQALSDVDTDYSGLTLADLEGDSTLATAAALAAVPAGIIATFAVSPDYTLADLDSDFSGDTLADVDAAAATLMDLTFYTP